MSHKLPCSTPTIWICLLSLRLKGIACIKNRRYNRDSIFFYFSYDFLIISISYLSSYLLHHSSFNLHLKKTSCMFFILHIVSSIKHSSSYQFNYCTFLHASNIFIEIWIFVCCICYLQLIIKNIIPMVLFCSGNVITGNWKNCFHIVSQLFWGGRKSKLVNTNSYWMLLSKTCFCFTLN